MKQRRTRFALDLHTAVTAFAGATLFLFPRASAALWPWPLPPLAARFMGALFVGGAVCSLVCLRAPTRRDTFVLVWLALGDALIVLTGLLAIAGVGRTAALVGFLVFFAALASLLCLAALTGEGAASSPPLPAALLRLLRGFFAIHLLVVLPVGVVMFFAPAWAQPLWPWKMTPLNIRLIGSFFFGAAFISTWALGESSAQSLRAVLALYTTFASLATLAALMHFGLFDPARITTWAFFALYVFVAAGSALLLRQLPSETAAASR